MSLASVVRLPPPHILDVEDVKFVINYDYPCNSEDYVHRIGRTGRSQRTGTAYTFFTPQNGNKASDLVSVLKEAKQVINPKLQDMADCGGYGVGRSRWRRAPEHGGNRGGRGRRSPSRSPRRGGGGGRRNRGRSWSSRSRSRSRSYDRRRRRSYSDSDSTTSSSSRSRSRSPAAARAAAKPRSPTSRQAQSVGGSQDSSRQGGNNLPSHNQPPPSNQQQQQQQQQHLGFNQQRSVPATRPAFNGQPQLGHGSMNQPPPPLPGQQMQYQQPPLPPSQPKLSQPPPPPPQTPAQTPRNMMSFTHMPPPTYQYNLAESQNMLFNAPPPPPPTTTSGTTAQHQGQMYYYHPPLPPSSR